MKIRFTLLTLVSLLLSFQSLLSNGVVIINGSTGVYLQLKSTEIDAYVNSQIAVVTSKQVFINQTGEKSPIKYAFPLHSQANAIELKWFINGQWHKAIISKSTQNDSIPGGPGGTIDPDLINYLGETPLLFTPLDSIDAGASVIFILKYVELLPYSFGRVDFFYQNDYRLIQEEGILDLQHFSFQLASDRTIEDIGIAGVNAVIQVSSDQALITFDLYESAALANYKVYYQLSSTELGVYSLSTFVPDSLLHCDEAGNGYVTLIIEPESNANTEVIEKNFSLIIDRSGSMSGLKIQQAKEAAAFIVNQLNFGDHFNIIDFSSNINMVFPELSPYTLENKTKALQYINAISASGTTNISGSLTTSINQFATVDTSKANIIIFLTDGMATAGITTTEGILNAVRTSVNALETEIFLFPFGIGHDINKKLLTLLALENNGIVSFLENEELQEKLTAFFLTVNNPVLLNTQFEFVPDIVASVYPDPLPNLYKGQQLIMSGRYSEPGDVNLILSGKAFSLPVTYSFTVYLADTNDLGKSFLPKIWAKQAIDKLTIDYNLTESEMESDSIQSLIDSMSICYGVISSQFTSFEDGGSTTYISEFDTYSIVEKFDAVISPNPFQNIFTLEIISVSELWGILQVTVVDQKAQKVASFEKQLNGTNSIFLCNELASLPPGIYYCIFIVGEDVVIRKIIIT